MALMTAKELEVLKTNLGTKKLDAKVMTVCNAAFDMIGTIMWGAASGIDIARWKLAPAKDPTPMNVSGVCWLGPLYIAYKAGVATEGKHIKAYNDATVKA